MKAGSDSQQGFVSAINGYLEPERFAIPEKELGEKETYTLEQTMTCRLAGKERVLSDFIKVEFTSDYTGQDAARGFQRANSALLEVKESYFCVERPAPETPPQSSNQKPGEGFVRVGPPYLVQCPGGTVLSGITKVDEQGKPLSDSGGNPIDSQTGKPVVCPQ